MNSATETSHLLSVLIWLPAIAGIFVLFLPRQSPWLLRAFGIGVGLFEFGKSMQLLIGSDYAKGFRFVENAEWIKSLGIRYHLGIDGLSLWLVLLTTFITPIAMYVAFGSIRIKQKEFIAAMLLLEAAMLGAFVALDMFLFYVFWELMLVPMYLIIGVFGGPNRVYAAVKFFIYTFAGSIFMLIAIVYMVIQYKNLSPTHAYSFDYFDLMKVGFPMGTEKLLFVAFALAFAIKVPMFPLHTWLPDAHTEAPTAGSVILAAVMLKLGTYGFLRFALPFFPNASYVWGPWIAGLACTGILYGAAVAWRQRDFKKLIAYSSVSHLGFVMLGIAARTPQSITGAVLQMVNHGISTGALFILVGVIYDRRHTRDLSEFGGLAKVMPAYAAFFVVVTMSSIGLPLTNGFIGEFLVISGTFMSTLLKVGYRYPLAGGGLGEDFAFVGPLYATLAALGVLFGAIYMLECVQKVFWGPLHNPKNKRLSDLNERELTGLVPLVALILLVGVKPEVFTSRIEPDATEWLNWYNAKREMSLADSVQSPYLLNNLPTPVGAMGPVAPAAGAENNGNAPAPTPAQPGQGNMAPPVIRPAVPMPRPQAMIPTPEPAEPRIAALAVLETAPAALVEFAR